MFDSINVDQLHPKWLLAHNNSRPFTLIDVRSLEEYQSGHVPGAQLIPLNTLMARVSDVPKVEDVFMICHSGVRSAQAADYLSRQYGYKNLFNVQGGTMAWLQAGYPSE